MENIFFWQSDIREYEKYLLQLYPNIMNLDDYVESEETQKNYEQVSVDIFLKNALKFLIICSIFFHRW